MAVFLSYYYAVKKEKCGRGNAGSISHAQFSQLVDAYCDILFTFIHFRDLINSFNKATLQDERKSGTN